MTSVPIAEVPPIHACVVRGVAIFVLLIWESLFAPYADLTLPGAHELLCFLDLFDY